MTDSLNLSRKQLASFLPTQELIRTFEELLRIVSSLSTESYDNVIDQLNSINDQLFEINNQISTLESAITNVQSQLTSFVDLVEPQTPYNDVNIKNRIMAIETHLGIK
jgi:hypothetical protein